MTIYAEGFHHQDTDAAAAVASSSVEIRPEDPYSRLRQYTLTCASTLRGVPIADADASSLSDPDQWNLQYQLTREPTPNQAEFLRARRFVIEGGPNRRGALDIRSGGKDATVAIDDENDYEFLGVSAPTTTTTTAPSQRPINGNYSNQLFRKIFRHMDGIKASSSPPSPTTTTASWTFPSVK